MKSVHGSLVIGDSFGSRGDNQALNRNSRGAGKVVTVAHKLTKSDRLTQSWGLRADSK